MTLDHLAREGSISYRGVVRDGLRSDGIGAFLTPAKWFSRVLMNAPAQGTVPWFYNRVLPLGEEKVKVAVIAVYHKSEHLRARFNSSGDAVE